jgi:MFS family permease
VSVSLLDSGWQMIFPVYTRRCVFFFHCVLLSNVMCVLPPLQYPVRNRVMTGISIGGSIPVIYSVLGDLYPANQRSAIAALITTGTGLGMGIGQVIAGSLDSWRLPFAIVAIPGMRKCNLQ